MTRLKEMPHPRQCKGMFNNCIFTESFSYNPLILFLMFIRINGGY